MIFLGIDPGFDRLGFGIIEQEANHYSLLEAGIISSTRSFTTGKRLLEIETQLMPLLKKYIFTAVAMEEVFFRKNLTTGVRLLEAKGVIQLSLAKHELEPIPVAPTSLKKLITGSGQADKKQMQIMITKLLKLNEKPEPDDAADAIGLALYAAIHRKGKAK